MARILVVDDDALVRETIALALQEAKHATWAAGDGRQALHILDGTPVDLVVSDILMPDLDGIELVRAIRRRHPNLRVLCISGGGREPDMDYLPLARKLGAQTVLHKPFTPKQLLEAVEAALHMPDLAEK
jgi:CheY-like chemotaxis protein